MVRFSEELIELQDFCQFRTELDYFPIKNTDNLYLEISLHFSDISTLGPPELFDPAVIFYIIIGL